MIDGSGPLRVALREQAEAAHDDTDSGTSATSRAISVAQAAPISSMRGMPSARAIGGPQAKTGGASPGPVDHEHGQHEVQRRSR